MTHFPGISLDPLDTGGFVSLHGEDKCRGTTCKWGGGGGGGT